MRYLLCLSLLPIGTTSVARDSSKIKQIEALFSHLNDKTPGCAVSILKKDKVWFEKTYGMANLATKTPISENSVFRMASVSKQFAAMAIALLEEDGKLKASDSFRKYFPEFKNVSAKVKISDLVHHTSGLKDYLILTHEMKAPDYYMIDEALGLLATSKITTFKPGQKFDYSNSNYFLISELVRRVSGKSLRVFAGERIFKPLGMKSTVFYDSNRIRVPKKAIGYRPHLVRKNTFVPYVTTLEMVGDGGLFTTLKDLKKWIRNFSNNKLGKGGQGLINKMRKPGLLANGKSTDYGYGLRVAKYKGLISFNHTGSFVGYRHATFNFPTQKTSIITMCNHSHSEAKKKTHKIIEILLGDKFKKETPEQQSQRQRWQRRTTLK